MRLTCPNCDAKYEIDDRLIPVVGRDVQCSDCGHSWYQYPPGSEFDLDEEDEDDAETLPPLPPARPDPVAPSPAARRTEATRPTTPPTAPQTTPPTASARKPLDENVAAILREEAAREAAVRAAEGRRPPRTIEVQADLGLASPSPRAHPTARPPEDLSSGPDFPAFAHRGALLPDIEQINSTLRSDTHRAPRPAAPEAASDTTETRPSSGFRIGFVSVIVFAVLLLLLNTHAPRLAAAVPALAGPLATYTGLVDRAQTAINSVLDRIIASP